MRERGSRGQGVFDSKESKYERRKSDKMLNREEKYDIQHLNLQFSIASQSQSQTSRHKTSHFREI